MVVIHTLEQEIQSLPANVRDHGYQGVIHQLSQMRYSLEEANIWPDEIPMIKDIL
jgi:hypothetical protein